MLLLILILLIVFWLLGLIQINIPTVDPLLFTLRGVDVSLFDLIIFFLIVGAIGILPTPFRQIAGVILVLWLLAFFGFIALAGLPNILILGLIIGIVVAMIS